MRFVFQIIHAVLMIIVDFVLNVLGHVICVVV